MQPCWLRHHGCDVIAGTLLKIGRRGNLTIVGPLPIGSLCDVFFTKGLTVGNRCKVPSRIFSPKPVESRSIGGANSNMINMHAVSDYYLDRGMATVGLDGPGQGEFRARTGRACSVKDFDKALSAVADFIQEDSRLDGKRIGIYGRATGSLLAMHAAALDKRFKAVVAHPAAFNVADYFQQAFAHTLVSHRLEMCSFMGAKTIEEGTRLMHELTLADVAARIDFPILSVCSADDETMPTTQSHLLKERVKSPVEIVTFPGKGHGGPSRLSLPLEADWMRDRLNA